jgi:Holliday junction resolvase-like predicted endonuclease
MRVTKSKQKRIATAASEYLSLLSGEPGEVRFDVIAVAWPEGQSPRIEHLESAFVLDDD